MTIPRRMTPEMKFGIMPIADQMKPLPFGALTKEEQRRRMLGFPATVKTHVYFPTEIELIKLRQKGVTDPVEKIIETTDANGGVTKTAVNGNDEVVDVEKTNNFVPLAIAAVIAFALFGG